MEHIGQNIRRLRREKGLTIVELARRIGIQPGPLGNLERGLHGPSARVVTKLCDVLDTSANDIFASAGRDRQPVWQGTTFPQAPYLLTALDGAGEGHKQKVQASDFPHLPHLPPRVIKLANQSIRDYLSLEDIVGVQKHLGIPLQLPADPSEAGLERLAQRLRGFLHIEHSVVFDYVELLESYGFRILFVPLPKEIHSFAYHDPKNVNAFFFLNQSKTPERQLSRLIAEIAMLILGQPPNHFPVDEQRRHAKRLAAFFLMPANVIQSTVAQLGIDQKSWSFELLLRIKSRFGVSAQSFLIRLETLDLITPKDAKAHKAKIEEFYRQTNFKEPAPSKRVTTSSPLNGRFGDLLHQAQRRFPDNEEVREIGGRYE